MQKWWLSLHEGQERPGGATQRDLMTSKQVAACGMFGAATFAIASVRGAGLMLATGIPALRPVQTERKDGARCVMRPPSPYADT